MINELSVHKSGNNWRSRKRIINTQMPWWSKNYQRINWMMIKGFWRIINRTIIKEVSVHELDDNRWIISM